MFAKKLRQSHRSAFILLFIVGLSPGPAFRARHDTERELVYDSQRASKEHLAEHWAPVPRNKEVALTDPKMQAEDASSGLFRRDFISKIAKISAAPILSQALPQKASAEGGLVGYEMTDDFKQDVRRLNGQLFGGDVVEVQPLTAPKGSETMMSEKDFGSCAKAPMAPLRWDASVEMAERLCCKNRLGREPEGYWEKSTNLLGYVADMPNGVSLTFRDSITGKPLFIAPKGRTWESWLRESNSDGRPTFRDKEVVLENVRLLPSGEVISTDGTHLGLNSPDSFGNRYGIETVCIAGLPRGPVALDSLE
jgi:hypothetical protein